MRKQILFGVLALALVSCGGQRPADRVNVFDGTDSAGNTYPGATVPFGAVQLSPDTDVNAPSGYHYSHDTILGFSHTHLSGTDGPDLGDFLVTPGLNAVEPLSLSHKNEVAEPGYYKVTFAKGITAELTVTPHAGIHRYTFTGEGTRLVRIDARHCIGGWSKATEYRLSLDGSEILGYRRVNGWTKDREVFLSAVFSKPFLSAVEPEPGLMEFTFADDLKEVVLFAGISGVDANGARGNRVKQTAGGQFDGLRRRAGNSWDEALGRITVKGGPTDAFYTHFYQTFTAPTRIDDYDRRYRDQSGRNLQLPEGHHFYSTQSLGDSFPVWNALAALLDTALVHDVVRGLVDNPGGRSELPARYVLTSIGLDPVAPASGEYILKAPLFRESVLRLANGKTLTIRADHPNRSYIAGVDLNGKPVDRNWLTYDEILGGGVLSFQLSTKPVKERENPAGGRSGRH